MQRVKPCSKEFSRPIFDCKCCRRSCLHSLQEPHTDLHLINATGAGYSIQTMQTVLEIKKLTIMDLDFSDHWKLPAATKKVTKANSHGLHLYN